ncbi:hypothetical protein MMC20_002491 [Loxospora ochrophaea]|nr:hypothetical protein [Loxospora ochrophaea]
MAMWNVPNNNLQAAMDINEGVCNGVWNTILTSCYFQTNAGWSVMPEYTMISIDNMKHRPDLTICDTGAWPAPAGQPLRATIPTPHLIYEGKFTGKDAKFDNARKQALGYMRVSDCPIAMIALGSKVIFTTFIGLRQDDRCITIGRGGNLAVTKMFKPLDIATDQQMIHDILTWVAGRNPIPEATN